MIISKEHLWKLLDEFSVEELQIILMEECSELQKEISKQLRNKGDLNHVCEEMAHVLICIDAVKYIYGISLGDIMTEIKKKGGDAYESEDTNTVGTTSGRQSEGPGLDTSTSREGL